MATSTPAGMWGTVLVEEEARGEGWAGMALWASGRGPPLGRINSTAAWLFDGKEHGAAVPGVGEFWVRAFLGPADVVEGCSVESASPTAWWACAGKRGCQGGVQGKLRPMPLIGDAFDSASSLHYTLPRNDPLQDLHSNFYLQMAHQNAAVAPSWKMLSIHTHWQMIKTKVNGRVTRQRSKRRSAAKAKQLQKHKQGKSRNKRKKYDAKLAKRICHQNNFALSTFWCRSICRHNNAQTPYTDCPTSSAQEFRPEKHTSHCSCILHHAKQNLSRARGTPIERTAKVKKGVGSKGPPVRHRETWLASGQAPV